VGIPAYISYLCADVFQPISPEFVACKPVPMDMTLATQLELSVLEHCFLTTTVTALIRPSHFVCLFILVGNLA